MAPESHGEKKRMIWPFLPSKWVKLSVLLIWFNFFDWSELIRVQFYFIFIFLFDPSWSKSIRVDPTWTGGPSWSGPTFVPASVQRHYFLMCHVFLRLNVVIQWCASTRRNVWWRYWKVHFVTFKSCHLVTEKHFPIYDLAWNQQYFYSCLYALKPFPNMCTLIFMFNFFVLKDGIWSPSEWVQKLIRGCEFLASDNNLLLYHTITSEQCFSCTLIG